ncbi:peptide ABC transporter ATP-binding protein [Pseudomonas chlororaphis]|jgi:peptide/nickel transport system ATP-binding protein|uniref:ABC-type dipeptide transporter n=1 Tax=Pseudomonas morbosilactucae TaxID=2938197 RepID=A0ABT0JB38_9PSED|nr:ABC transporter ATP-binding protein [Pseudomonas morbosilactucae]MCK9813095.1 ABC transporter ATP-binding protein [Pseudomonas morbosilactucae]ROL73693.1 peptide ABC transporter ATP-binding protein [Pseudomonas chlororaphis]WEK09938.1 MAG: ABC transporter ATP-binding protein [Pseudomonas sp.]
MSAIKLNVEGLNVRFVNGQKETHAVRDVSFTLGREKLAIVGESGSGKSTVGRSLLKLHPASAKITAKAMQFGDIDLLSAGEKAMQKIRGQRISMIMQDPKYSLNPVVKVGDQIAEAYLAHHKASRSDARERVMEMLEKVHIRDPKRVYNLYPHEVSGGMGQRIMIAMMVITRPEVIIADEPTSALDVSVRQQVLSVLEELVEQQELGLIFVSHDLNLVRNYCDRVLVMYAGRVVESLAACDLQHAQHPYTRGLLAALPSMDNRRERLPVLQRDPLWLTS